MEHPELGLEALIDFDMVDVEDYIMTVSCDGLGAKQEKQFMTMCGFEWTDGMYAGWMFAAGEIEMDRTEEERDVDDKVTISDVEVLQEMVDASFGIAVRRTIAEILAGTSVNEVISMATGSINVNGKTCSGMAFVVEKIVRVHGLQGGIFRRRPWKRSGRVKASSTTRGWEINEKHTWITVDKPRSVDADRHGG